MLLRESRGERVHIRGEGREGRGTFILFTEDLLLKTTDLPALILTPIVLFGKRGKHSQVRELFTAVGAALVSQHGQHFLKDLRLASWLC